MDPAPPSRRHTRLILALLAVIALIALYIGYDAFAPSDAAPAKPPLASTGKPAFREWAAHTFLADKAPPENAIDLQVDDQAICQLETLEGWKASPSASAAVTRSLATIVGELQAARSETDRALGLYAEVKLSREKRFDPFQVNKVQTCVDFDECLDAANQAHLRAHAAAIEALAAMAANSRDPNIYAGAFYLCLDHAVPGCAQISAANWAALDPANAVPWLYVAGAASQGNNLPAREDAMRRAAGAPLFEHRVPPLLDLAQTTSFQKAQPATRYFLASGFLTASYSASVEPLSALGIYEQTKAFCAPLNLQDAARRQTCGQLAEALTQRDGKVQGLATGTEIARHLDWPVMRLKALFLKADATTNAFSQVGMSKDKGTGSCPLLDRLLSWSGDIGRMGEIGAIQQNLSVAGKTTVESAEELRTVIPRLRKRAASVENPVK